MDTIRKINVLLSSTKKQLKMTDSILELNKQQLNCQEKTLEQMHQIIKMAKDNKQASMNLPYIYHFLQ